MSLLLPLLLAVVVGCQDADESSGGPPAALVELATATAGSLSDRWEVPGDVRALEGAELSAGADGPVTKVTVREGAEVSDGDLLLEVDRDLALAARDGAVGAAAEARAAHERAKRDLERLQQVDRSVLSASELDAAEAEVQRLAARVQTTEAAARSAEVELRRHRVLAPFTGVVTARNVDRGDWVSRGQHVLSLVSTGEVDVRVDVSPRLASAVKRGDAVVLEGDGEAPGTVAGVVPALDPSARTALVRVEPDAPTPWLVPGATVNVSFDVDVARPDAVLVPRDALVLGPVETRVVRVVDAAADPVTVEVLSATADTALVTGLSVGDRVVTRGNERLRPGQKVRVAEPEG